LQRRGVTLERDFDAGIAAIEVNPQDITRVLLNILGGTAHSRSKRDDR
jgi:hypothetical protein